MKQCKLEGCKVYLLTSKSLEGADWPREYLDDIFYIPDVNKEWNMQDVIYGVSFLARRIQIDKVVALDDFDVEKAASLREHLRIPGMGDTTARYFRDKLAMRMRAQETGIPVPGFIHILNHDRVNEFLAANSGPFVLKPRLQAGAIGIKKVNNSEELWDKVNQLGDQQSFYLLETFLPGDVYHVDSIIQNKEVIWSVASQYGKPPMEVSHQGRVFTSRTMVGGTKIEKDLKALNKKVLKSFGIVHGVSHSEFIQDAAGNLYFLETSARVGGANLADMIEAGTGVNLWAEWAKLEVRSEYSAPESNGHYSAIMQSLAKQEWPDLGAYSDPEVWWRMHKRYHAGLILSSPDYNRITELLDSYTQRFYNDFFTWQPVPDKPTS